jgi:5-formyltetrahydrofolate cyclo-ligase
MKSEQREHFRSLRQQIPDGLRQVWDQRIQNSLFQHPTFLKSRLTALTVSIGTEVDTHPVLQFQLNRGIPLALPLCHGKGEMTFHRVSDSLDFLIPGRKGILEPHPDRHPQLSLDEIELFILPGLGFDPYGHRLGQGGGYYDRTLGQIPRSVARLALAYSCQVIPNLEVSETDQPVDSILTEYGEFAFQEMEWVSHTPAETHQVSARLGKHLHPPMLLRLEGQLGAGKTEFVRGLLHSLGYIGRVRSPTFGLESVYPIGQEQLVYHLDGYRLTSPNDLDLDRFDEIIGDPSGMVLVEWPDRFGEVLDPFSPRLEIQILGSGARSLTYQAFQRVHHLEPDMV